MALHRGSLLGSGQPRPKWIEGRDVVVTGPPLCYEVVVVKHACVGVPQIFVDRIPSRVGPLLPLRRICCTTQQRSKVLHVALVFVKQTVEADRRIFIGGPAEWPKAEAGIETGFPHCAVSVIEGR